MKFNMKNTIFRHFHENFKSCVIRVGKKQQKKEERCENLKSFFFGFAKLIQDILGTLYMKIGQI